MKKRKVPLRKDIVTGEMHPKKDLVRVVKNKQDEVSVDPTGKKPGRGAYLCRSLACFQAARKARRFEKAFSMQIPDAVLERIEEELKANE